MDQVVVVVGAATAICVAVVLALVPMRLPWAQRVRWTVLSQSISNVGGAPTLYPINDVREVEVLSVDDEGGQLSVDICECGHPKEHALTVVGWAPAEVVAMLREWQLLGTPMIYFHDGAGNASLHGPVASITDMKLLPSSGTAESFPVAEAELPPAST